jgi:hypothetical protein
MWMPGLWPVISAIAQTTPAGYAAQPVTAPGARLRIDTSAVDCRWTEEMSRVSSGRDVTVEVTPDGIANGSARPSL